jgi:hypothetical protein
MWKFWLPWTIDAVVAAIVLFFFFWGLADGTVSSFNAGIWTVLLAALAVVVGGSLWLKTTGRRGLGIALALMLAVPGALVGLFFLALIVAHPRWN